MKQIGVQMHGVRLNLRCDYERLLEHVAFLLDGHTGPAWDAPDLSVNGYWRQLSREQEPDPFFDPFGLDAFGKRMYVGEDELVWPDHHRNKDLQLRFRREGAKYVFDVGYCYRPSTKKQARYPDYEAKKFFDLLRYLVLFPIVWHLERTRGWILIHASAVADGDRAVLIAGPGGAGKTTTSVALVARAGMTMVTENLLFCDGESLYPLYEPVRLTDESLELLGEDRGGLEPLGMPGGLKHKSMFRLPCGAECSSLKPDVLFIPQFSREGFARRIPSRIACEQLDAINRLTLELNDYYWYRSGLDLLWPQPYSAQRQLHVLQRLTSWTPCYALGIDRRRGIDPVVEQILQCRNNGVVQSKEMVQA
jgi:hypothetical protein